MLEELKEVQQCQAASGGNTKIFRYDAAQATAPPYFLASWISWRSHLPKFWRAQPTTSRQRVHLDDFHYQSHPPTTVKMTGTRLLYRRRNPYVPFLPILTEAEHRVATEMGSLNQCLHVTNKTSYPATTPAQTKPVSSRPQAASYDSYTSRSKAQLPNAVTAAPNSLAYVDPIPQSHDTISMRAPTPFQAL